MTVTFQVRGLKPGSYGVHVHTYGDLTGAFSPINGRFNQTVASFGSIGGHFDVLGRGTDAHGCQGVNDSRHTGDIGNLVIPDTANTPDAVTIFRLSSELLDLGVDSRYNNDSIVGRSVVIHENTDRCVQTGVNLGAWLAVGVIGIHSTPPTTPLSGNNATQDSFVANATNANVALFNAQGGQHNTTAPQPHRQHTPCTRSVANACELAVRAVAARCC